MLNSVFCGEVYYFFCGFSYRLILDAEYKAGSY